MLRKKCSYCSIGAASWENRGFDDADVAHLHTTNEDVLAHNKRNIIKVGNPIALVELEKTGNENSITDENFGNLIPSGRERKFSNFFCY